MALQSGGGQNDLYFSAELQDNVTPQADQIEKRLKELGASKSEIKMFLTAYDQATPQIKAAHEQLNKLPKKQMIDIQTNASVARKALDDLKRAVAAPITVTMHIKDDFDQYVSSLKMRAMSIETRLKQALTNTPLFAGVLGASSSAYGFISQPLTSMTGLPFSSLGVGLTGLGAAGATGAFMAKSFQANANLEQQMTQLVQILRTPSAAQTAYQQVTQTAQHTPFNQPDVLSAYVQMAQMGTNPTNRAFGIKAAANLGAGSQVPISQATGALQNASLGYFESFNNLTGRNIRQSDFTYGGRYSGQTYEQAVLSVLKQYQGASQAQMQTFKGLMTNIQDVIQQKLVLPAGKPIFDIAKGFEQHAASTLQSPHFQIQLSQEVDKIQKGLYNVYELVQKGAYYFKSSLEQPLKNVANNVLQVGQAFGHAFGGTVITGVKYLSQALTTLLQPITKLTAAIPQIGEIAGLLKGLHMLGISTNTGLGNIFGGLGHLNPIEMIRGFGQLSSLLAKIGLYFTAKTIMDMANANKQLNSSFQDLGSGGGSALDGLKMKFDALIVRAAELGTTVDQIKSSGAELASVINPDVGMKKRLDFAYYGGLDTAKLNAATGTDQTQIVAQFLKAINASAALRGGVSPRNLADRTTNQIYQAEEELTKTLGVTLPDAAKALSTALLQFGKDLHSVHMYGIRGAGAVASLQGVLSRPGALTDKDVKILGTTDPNQIISNLIQLSHIPSVPVLRKALQNGTFNQLYDFQSQQPVTGRHLDNLFSQFAPYQNITSSDKQAQLGLMRTLGPSIVNGLGIQLPQFPNVLTQKGPYGLGNQLGPVGPGLPMLGAMSKTQMGQMSPQEVARGIIEVKNALDQEQVAYQNVNQAITKYNDQLSQLQLANEQAAAAIAQEQLKMTGLQNTVDQLQLSIQTFQTNAINPLSRAIAEADQQMQNFQQNAILPVQHAQDQWNQTMLMTSNRLEDVSFAMQKAQYNMDKFNGGMLTGENAVTANIEALTIYNEKLQMLSLMNMGLQADLTRTQIHQGFTSTVQPLVGFDLQREIQLGQERQQIAQSQYDTTYGYQHWKLQRAARTIFQKMEMPYAERLAGTKAAAHTLSIGQVETMAIQEKQYQEQLHSRVLEEEMYKLQLRTWPLQQHQFDLNKRMFDLQNGPVYHMQQQMAIDSNTIARNLLPLQEKQRDLGEQQTVIQANIDKHLYTLNNTLGKLQGSVADLHGIMGILTTVLASDIKTGPGSVLSHLPTIAKDLGLSQHFIHELLTAFGLGGKGGGGTPFNTGSNAPIPHGGGGVGGILSTIWNLITNPLQILSHIGDIASQGWGSLTHMPFGTLAGIGAAGFGGLALANAGGIGMDKFLGHIALPKLASKFASPGEGLVADIRNLLSRGISKWADSTANTSAIGDLFRPMTFAVRKFASIGAFALTQVLGHFIPGGHLVSIPLGIPIAQEAERRASSWYRDKGMFGLSRSVIGQFFRGIQSELSRVVDGFTGPEGSFLKGIWKAVTLLPHSLARLVTWPVRALSRSFGSIVKDTISGLSGKAGTVADSIGKDVPKFTKDRPGIVGVISNRLAGLFGQGSVLGDDAQQLATDAGQLEMFPGVGKGGAPAGQLELFPASSATSEAKSMLNEQKTTTQTLKEAAGSFATTVKTFATNMVSWVKTTATNAHASLVSSDAARLEASRASRIESAAKESAKAGQEIQKASGGFLTSMRDSIKSSSVFQKASDLLHGSIGGTFEKVVGFLGDHIKGFGRFVGRFGIGIGLFEALPDKFKTPIEDFAKSIGSFIKDGVSKFVGVIKDNLTQIAKDIGTAVSKFATVVSSMITKLAEILHIKTPGTADAARIGEEIGARLSSADLTSTSAEASKMSALLDRSPALKSLAQKALNAGSKVIEIGGKVFRIAAGAAGALSFLPAGIDAIQGKYGQAAVQAANAGSYFIPGVGEGRIALDVLHMIFGNSIPSSSQALSNFYNRYTQPGVTGSNVMPPNPLGGILGSTPGSNAQQGASAGAQQYYPVQLPPGFGSGVNASNAQQAQTIASQTWKLTRAQQQEYLKLSGEDQYNAYQAALTGPQGLQNYLNTYQKLSNTSLKGLLQTHSLSLAQLKKAYSDFYGLSKTDQQQFLQDYQNNQSAGLSALLSGPGGLQKFLASYGGAMVNFHNANLGAQAQASSLMDKTTNVGYQAMAKTTTSWLNALTKTIAQWAQKNGLPVSQNQATIAAVQGAGGYFNVGGYQISAGALAEPSIPGGSSFAHGGMVEADEHKVGPGRVVRMVEEGHPEVVIPLAPHRRDRARSLVKQTEAMLGGYGGYAAGGYVYPIPGFSIGRLDEGVDVSAAAGTPVLAMGDSKFVYQIPGWFGSESLYQYQLLDGIKKGAYWYIAEQFSPSSTSPGATWKAGQLIGRYAASGTGIEMGWGASLAASGGHGTLAQATTGYTEGQITPAAQSFYAFIQGLAHGKLVAGGPSSIGGVGGALLSAIHLMGPPNSLKDHGVAGTKEYAVLNSLVKQWQKHLNTTSAPASGAGSGSGIYKFGATPAGGYSPTSWAQALLKGLHINPTQQDVLDILAWEQAEGGNWNNSARYNPLNTTQQEPGSTVMGGGSSAGVQAYTSWAQGLLATAQTLNNGSYSSILTALRSGNLPVSSFGQVVGASPWGTAAFANGGFINPLALGQTGSAIVDFPSNQHHHHHDKSKKSSPSSTVAGGQWIKVGATIDPTMGQAPTYSAHGGMSFAELLVAGSNAGLRAQDLAATLGMPNGQYGLPMETSIGIRMPGSSQAFKIWKNDNGSGQAGNPFYKVDLHQAIADALHWQPNQAVEVSKLAGGLPRVPYDNYLALLHQGETVVPAGTSNMMDHHKHHHHSSNSHILKNLDGMHKDILKAMRHDHGSPLGYRDKQVDQIHKAVVDARKAVEKVRTDIAEHKGAKTIAEDMAKARAALEKMYDIQRYDYMQSVFQDINNNSKQLNNALKSAIDTGARKAGEVARDSVKHGQSPFGTGTEQTSNAARQLIDKLHNIPITKHGQTHYVSLQEMITKAHQDQTNITTESQVMAHIKQEMAGIKDHSSKHYKHLAHQFKHEASMREKSMDMYKKELGTIHTAEKAFIKEEEKKGVSRNLIMWAIKNVGLFDNQGLYSDAQLYGIPPALLKQAGSYRNPSGTKVHPDPSSLHHQAQHHHQQSQGHHSQHHQHQKKHYNDTMQSYKETKKFEDDSSKKFDKMINCLGDIHHSLDKIQPKVQNNLLVQVTGFSDAHKPKIRVSTPANR